MNSLSNILNEDKSANLEDENNKFQKLMSRPEINGKEIDFNEFHDMIKPEKPKQNIIYVKKSKGHKDFSYSIRFFHNQFSVFLSCCSCRQAILQPSRE